MEWTNEWIEQGVKQGVKQGRQQGQRDIIRRLLQRRVGVLPTKLARQFDRLDDANIIALGDALLDFENLVDAQQWLTKRKRPVRAGARAIATCPACGADSLRRIKSFPICTYTRFSRRRRIFLFS